VQFFVQPRLLEGGREAGQLVALAAGAQRFEYRSAASMPVLMAAWLPLMRLMFRKPASQPISAPPGNTSFGSDCRPPAAIARAP
jgi:hypothetical protein